MKKLIAAILAVLFLASSTGATVHMHYCMGKLASWGLTHEKTRTCGNCGMEKSSEKDNGCCKDEQKFVKNTADQKIAETPFHFVSIVSEAVLPDYPDLPALQISSLTEENPLSHAPPRNNGVAIHILHQVFLI